MKLSLSRALVAIAALALSIPAFAQMTINGYYRVGGRANVPAAGSAVANFDDRIRLNLSFAAPDDMFGFKARLQANSSGTTSGLVTLFQNSAATTGTANLTTGVVTATTTMTAPGTIKFGQAYAKLLDGMVKITAGRLDIADYAAYENTGNIYLGNVSTESPTLTKTLLGGQNGNTTGAIVQLWPLEGLSIAMQTRIDGTLPGAHHLGFDAYYFIPGFGKVLVESQLGTYSAVDATASDDLAKSFVSGGFQYLGFKGLTATAAFRYNGSDNNAMGAIAIIEYGTGPFWANVSADLDLTNAQTYIEGEAVYTVIPQLKVRAYGAYDDGAKNKVLMGKNSTTFSTYMAGADLVFPIGKGELMAGVNYTDSFNLQFPILIKANF